MQRRTFIRNAGIAGGIMAVSPLLGNNLSFSEDGFPLMDLLYLMDRRPYAANNLGSEKKEYCH